MRTSGPPASDDRSPYERLGHDDSPLFSRRSFLRTSAFALAGATMYACTGGGRKQPVVAPSATASVVATETRWPIKRVIYLMMENRSFDNLFGRFPGSNGATVGVKFGQEVPLTPSPHWLPGDIPHDRAAHLNDVNGGTYDGFGNGQFGDPWAYTQFEEASIPNYWSWARDYVLCDNFFGSVGGPSYPNHFFFVAGQSGGALDNPENIEVRTMQDGRTFKSWGCDAVGKNVFVLVKDEQGNLTKHDSCFTFKTVPEQLEEAGVPWAYYSAQPGQAGYFWNALNGIAGVFHSDLWRPERIRSVERLPADIRAGRLPAVTWVTPRFELSDHPPESTCFAHNWLTGVVNAIMESDDWEHTALFVTWDEWGGFYDHVPPPEVDDIGFGFRVPTLADQPVREEGLRRRRRGRVLDPAQVRRGQLGPAVPHRADRAHPQLRARVRVRAEPAHRRAAAPADRELLRQAVRIPGRRPTRAGPREPSPTRAPSSSRRSPGAGAGARRSTARTRPSAERGRDPGSPAPGSGARGPTPGSRRRARNLARPR